MDKRKIDIYGERAQYRYNGLVIEPVYLSHDVPNCGYKLCDIDNMCHIFYATDTGDMGDIEAKGYDYYFLESNHRTEELEERAAKKLSKGEFAYEVRAARTHLSYEQAMDWLYQNMGPNSRYILLHQHIDTQTSSDIAEVRDN